ncbi:MAG TPA: hypothetical protein VHP37_05940 [Burkholderiales bacterium]|nr:hypothetical protein [Burkholderiales bacterium]
MIGAARILAAAALVAICAAGCGERPQVTVYKQGEYKGKPDNLPWQGPPFNGNKVEWEKAVSGRTSNQNEYSRIAN